MTRLLTLLIPSLVLAMPRAADAFCGFYVAGSDTKLYNNATMVTLLRDGTTTVMSMRNNYQGPPEDFAMVVPVPVVLQKENVKTLPKTVFERIDKLAAPRLVEYWEQDPCPKPGEEGWPSSGGGYGPIGQGSGVGSGYGAGTRSKVIVEAEFEVGEYEIVILSAKDAVALEQWITGNGYKIPDGAAPYLRPYVEDGSRFFVAKVNPKKVKFANGMAELSPLRFHFTSKEFRLPVRLGLINSSGTQDLIVHILAKHTRYEVANYRNVTIPTNLIVDDSVREQFGAFYAALFDATLEKNPGAVVTEYAWNASSCDPCPEPPLTLKELMTLGLDVMGGDKQTGFRYGGMPSRSRRTPRVRIGNATVTGDLDKNIIRRYIRRKLPRLKYCYEKQLLVKPRIKGSVVTSFVIDPTGSVLSSTAKGIDKTVSSCMARVMKNITFPKPEGGGIVKVKYPFKFDSSKGSGSSRRWAPAANRGWILTRLHARYDRNSLGEDLTFGAVEPIRGGQGGASDKLDKASSSASVNTFQGRYIIRHEWTGPMECDNPRRGMWGGPPPGVKGDTTAKPALNLAFAPRGGMTLASMVREPVAAIALTPAPLGDPAAAKPAPPEAVQPPAQPPAPDEHKRSDKNRGCGCASSDAGTGTGSLLLMLVVFANIGRRRRGRVLDRHLSQTAYNTLPSNIPHRD